MLAPIEAIIIKQAKTTFEYGNPSVILLRMPSKQCHRLSTLALVFVTKLSGGWHNC